MEVDLKCNVAQCRKNLIDCANNTFTSALVCPACETSLTENDDIVFTDLNPNEDYKASVLSGLRPDIIVEICSRSLSFWTYQTTQEAYFQKMLYKNLQEKCSQLEKQMQSVIRDAQEEIASLKSKVQAIQKDLELEKHKNHDFAEQLQEKTRQFSKLQIMYDKLKRRSLVPAMQQTVQNTNNGDGNGITGIGSQQGTNRLYGNHPQSWNLKNNSQEYRLNSDQIPFAPCNVNGGRKITDGNDANKNFQSNAHFPPIRNPFVMKSNTGMRVMAPSGGVR
nr:11456_t:CDS:10 [Entrophospora candida]